VSAGTVLTASKWNQDVVANWNTFGDAWSTYTPTLTNIAVGTGGSAKNAGRYIRVGRLVLFEVELILGTSGASVSGLIGISLPVTQQAADRNSFHARMRDGTTYYGALLDNSVSERVDIYAANAGGQYLFQSATSATVPFTWGAGDGLHLWGFYEASSAS
jgi:hypothetical protein